MKKINLIVLTIFYSLSVYSQIFNANGGEHLQPIKKTECLTSEERNGIIAMLQENQQQLSSENKRLFSSEKGRGAGVLFSWPVTKSSNSDYESVWAISNYVDHNSNYPNLLTDYNCGTRTYDTNSGYNHRGIDIYNWPFTWKIMDNDEAEVIAAAAGQIIGKTDGNFDRSCSLSGGSWNAIYVEHSDGTIAWYGHMKNGSLTSKSIGEVVAEGEFLGIVGSSGNSTEPHLHFEVWEDSSYTNLLDPYAGPCNSLNATSLWQSQRPYLNPHINAALTHSAPPLFPSCPTSETTNESNEFEPSDTIYFAIYMRDQMNGTNINLKIIRPDSSILYNWNFNFTADLYSSYWYWFYNGVFDQEGEWKWEVSYEGQTVTHHFTVENALSVEENHLDIVKIYPNPFAEEINIDSNSKIIAATLFDVLGNNVLSLQRNHKNITSLSTKVLAKGLYFLRLEDENHHKEVVKIIKK